MNRAQAIEDPYEAYVRKCVAAAPPLDAEQRATIHSVLHSGSSPEPAMELAG